MAHVRDRAVVHVLLALVVLASGTLAGAGVRRAVAPAEGPGGSTKSGLRAGGGLAESSMAPRDDEPAERALASSGLPDGVWAEARASEPGSPGSFDSPAPPSRSEGSEGAPGGRSGDSGSAESRGAPGAPGAPDGREGSAERDESVEAPALDLPVEERFVDPCTSAGTGACPVGEPGTVVGGGRASASLTHGLDLAVHPYLTRAEHPGLRCDPGFVTRGGFPVVVTTNRPVADLRIAVGPAVAEAGRWEDEALLLDEALETDPRQAAAWLLALALAGEPTGAGLEEGLHHCFRVPLDEVFSPHVLSGEDRLGEVDPAPLTPGETGVVEGTGVDLLHGEEATERTSFLVRGVDDLPDRRPAVSLRPLDWDVLQVSVPQRDPERGHEAVAAAYVAEREDGLRGATPPCVAATNRRDWVDRVSERALPRPVDRAVLADPSYPYDRSYDHLAVWNLRVREGAEHEICVWWLDGSGALDEVEAYAVTPPNRQRVRLELRELEIHDDRRGELLPDGGLRLRTIGLPCLRSLPDGELRLPRDAERWVLPEGALCDSGGRRVPERLGLVAEVAPGVYRGLDPEPDGRLVAAPRWIETDTDPVCDGVVGEPCPDRVDSIRLDFPERRTGTRLCGRSGLRARGDASCRQPSTATYSALVDVVTYDGPWSPGVSALDWEVGEPFTPRTDRGSLRRT